MLFSYAYLILNLIFLNVICTCLGSPLRKSCGSQLNKRLSLICERRGGYNIFLNAGPADFRRQRRAIVQECCRNTCTDKDLFGYCRYDSIEENSSEEIADKEIPEPVYDSPKGIFPTMKEYSVRMVKSFEGHIIPTDFPPIEVGTVSSEYTKSTVSMILAN